MALYLISVAVVLSMWLSSPRVWLVLRLSFAKTLHDIQPITKWERF